MRVLACALLLAGCRDAIPEARSPDLRAMDLDHATAIPDTFEELYPVFLLRKVSAENKALLWRERYQGRWVRWTGTLVSITPNGATFKHLPGTITVDVNLRLEPSGKDKIRRFKPGDRVTYVGQLVRYEEVIRTFHLAHGDVVAP